MDAGVDNELMVPRQPWWRDRALRPVLAMFALVALALIGGVLLIFNTIEAERSERDQVGRTSEVLAVLRDINRAAINGETGQRGYFITLDRRYLAPYLVNRERMGPAVARLRTLLATESTPRQRTLVNEVERLAAAKFAELDETVAQIDRGDIMGVRSRILSDEGQDVMERLRRAVGELEVSENGVRAKAEAVSVTAERQVISLLLWLLAVVVATLGLGLWLVVRTARAEARAANAAALREARDRADLLARELNHRVKNLFAVVLAIVRMSGRDAPEAKPVIDRIANRIHALLKAHEVTTGSLDKPVAELRELVETAVEPYLSDANLFEIEGPEAVLPARDVVPIGLVLHELVTNTVKYGAWSAPGGKLSVTWMLSEAVPPQLALKWRETCAGPCPGSEHKGFGSLLVQSSARQLGGTATRVFHDDGVELDLDFPLRS